MGEHSRRFGSLNSQGYWFIWLFNKRGGVLELQCESMKGSIGLFHPDANGQSPSYLEASPEGDLWQMNSYLLGTKGQSSPKQETPLEGG